MNTVPTLPFLNPATGEKFGEVVMTTPEQVAQAHTDMRRAFEIWRQKPLAERIRIIRQFQAVLIDSLDEITTILNKNCGKTRQDALIEVFITANIIDQYCKHAPRWLRPRRVPAGLYIFKRYYTEQRPYGVVGVIGPWNYPIVMTIPPVISALLAGNTVLCKPSEVTAGINVVIADLFRRVPELAPFVRVLHGDGAVGAALVKSAPDLIFLTGSTPTGKKVLQTAAETLTPVISELGGKDAMIVLEDADLDAAAKWGVWGSYFNAGQTCMAVERVYVVESVYDRFVELALAYTRDFKMGYSENQDCEYSLGPLTFQRQVEIVEDHLQDAQAKGARILIGGKREGMFVEPTLMVDVDHSMRLMREETLGPIMAVMKVKDEAEAIRLANDCQYGLGASIWSSDIGRAERVARQIDAGTLLINDTLSHFAVPHLPFGGVKQTGTGRIHGQQDLLQFTRTHSYAVGRPPIALDIATQMRKPGNYRLGATRLRLAFGVTPQQRLQGVQSAIPEVQAQARPLARKVALAGLATATSALLFALLRGRKS